MRRLPLENLEGMQQNVRGSTGTCGIVGGLDTGGGLARGVRHRGVLPGVLGTGTIFRDFRLGYGCFTCSASATYRCSLAPFPSVWLRQALVLYLFLCQLLMVNGFLLLLPCTATAGKRATLKLSCNLYHNKHTVVHVVSAFCT